MQATEAEFREGLEARLDVLEIVRGTLVDDPDGAVRSIERIARSLRAAAALQGRAELEKAAAELESAGPDDVGDRLDRVTRLLRSTISEAPTDSLHILVIEDDPISAKIVQSTLTSKHREIVIAPTAAAAERLLSKQRYSLIVLDLILPDLDGRNLLISLRQNPHTRTTPIFVLTGQTTERTKIECMALGADLCLDKPIRPNLLAAAVSAKLQLSHETVERALKDPLTGLDNQTSFAETYGRMVALAKRLEQPLAICLVDVDGLDEINTLAGRRAGDRGLEHAATLLQKSLRRSDLIARWESDEFVVLLPNTGLEGAVRALTNALEQLQEQTLELDQDTELGLTFSAGIVLVGEIPTAAEAVAEADKVLYHAKRAGAGTIYTSEDELGSRSTGVLLVEDDPVSAAVIRHRLQRDGFEVHHYTDGLEALEAAMQIDAILVILDLKLPGIDGFELLMRLRESAKYERVPVAIVSGLGREEDVVRALQLGADDYIIKPFSTAELRARLHRLLSSRGNEQVAPAGGVS